MFEEFKTYLQSKSVEITSEMETYIDQSLERKSFKKNEILIQEGDTCQYTFFVAKGLLRAYTIDPNGKEHILQFGAENWFISDRSSAMFQDASDQNIEAVEDSEVIFIEAELFDKLSEISPSFQRFNFTALNKHIRQLHKRINLLISAPAEVRYMHFIKLYPDLTLRVPQWMIASYLGITPESLSRVRKELAQKNFKTDC